MVITYEGYQEGISKLISDSSCHDLKSYTVYQEAQSKQFWKLLKFDATRHKQCLICHCVNRVNKYHVILILNTP